MAMVQISEVASKWAIGLHLIIGSESTMTLQVVRRRSTELKQESDCILTIVTASFQEQKILGVAKIVQLNYQHCALEFPASEQRRNN